MNNEELEYFQNKLKETMGKGLPKKYLETTDLGDVDKEYEHRFKERIESHLADVERIKSEFSERWGLKIEERELSLEERYGLSRVNGISPKYSFEIEDGKPTPNKMSESEWYDNHNIPTKLITITYNDKRIESYE